MFYEEYADGRFQKKGKSFPFENFQAVLENRDSSRAGFLATEAENGIERKEEQGGAAYSGRKMQISECISVHKRKSFQKRPKSFLFENFSALSENRNEKIALQ